MTRGSRPWSPSWLLCPPMTLLRDIVRRPQRLSRVFVILSHIIIHYRSKRCNLINLSWPISWLWWESPWVLDSEALAFRPFQLIIEHPGRAFRQWVLKPLFKLLPLILVIFINLILRNIALSPLLVSVLIQFYVTREQYLSESLRHFERNEFSLLAVEPQSSDKLSIFFVNAPPWDEAHALALWLAFKRGKWDQRRIGVENIALTISVSVKVLVWSSILVKVILASSVLLICNKEQLSALIVVNLRVMV